MIVSFCLESWTQTGRLSKAHSLQGRTSKKVGTSLREKSQKIGVSSFVLILSLTPIRFCQNIA
jgi:hypothetical protein